MRLRLSSSSGADNNLSSRSGLSAWRSKIWGSVDMNDEVAREEAEAELPPVPGLAMIRLLVTVMGIVLVIGVASMVGLLVWKLGPGFDADESDLELPITIKAAGDVVGTGKSYVDVEDDGIVTRHYFDGRVQELLKLTPPE